MHTEKANAQDSLGAAVLRGAPLTEQADAHGVFDAICFDKDGNVKWEERFNNVVCTEGKAIALDAFLAGSGYNVVGPFMGLISSVGWTAVAAGDTMAQLAGTNGWREAGSASNFPLYTTPRKTCVWSAASGASKALSAALSFPVITTGGTVKGAFIVFGTGAVSTIGDTNGKLWSAGTFSGDKVVSVGDTIQVSYTTSL